MQDGATSHTNANANATLELLTQKFGDRISQETDNPMASHSADLNPSDFFL